MVDFSLFVTRTIENAVSILIAVIAYKIYRSRCHTYVHTKLFGLDLNGGDGGDNRPE